MTEWAHLEDARYSWRWGHGYGAARPLESVILAGCNSRMKCLDLGCGNAVLSHGFKDYVGVDVSSLQINVNKAANPGRYHHASLDDLSCVAGESFDVAVCNDTMEHIPPEHVDAVLASIAGVDAKLFVFNVCCRDSSSRGPDGETLHPTIQPPAWWLAKLGEYFTVEVLKEEPTRLICKGTKL